MRRVLVVNPGPKENLYTYAKQNLGATTSKKEFYRLLVLFKAQHGYYPKPKDLKMIKMNVPNKVNGVVLVGDCSRIDYETKPQSKKTQKGTRTVYYHDMNKTKLVSDVTGHLYLTGPTRLKIKDGMLHEPNE